MFFGFTALILALCCGLVFPGMLDRKLKASAYMCSMDQVAEAQFYNPHDDCELCVPYYFNYYPFHLANAAAVLHETSTPLQIHEKGPYVYRKFVTRFNVSLSSDAATISYQSYNTWRFEPSLSCRDCDPDVDRITSLDTGYLLVMTQAGGEAAFMTAFLNELIVQKNIPKALASLIPTMPLFSTQLLKAINGINSLNLGAMETSLAVLSPLLKAMMELDKGLVSLLPLAINFLEADFSGLAFSGLLSSHTVTTWAMGAPSFIAGMAVTGAGAQACERAAAQLNRTKSQTIDWCQQCAANRERYNMSLQTLCVHECQTCVIGEVVTDLSTSYLCDKVQRLLASSPTASFSTTHSELTLATRSAQVVSQTCQLCASEAMFCLAPLPGSVEMSGFDYNVDPFNPLLVPTSRQHTGCQDADTGTQSLGNFIVSEGYARGPIWVTNQITIPTTAEFASFAASHGTCPAASSNDDDANENENATAFTNTANQTIVCRPVSGSDGQGVPPLGANLYGFALDKDLVPSLNLYVPQAKMNVTLVRAEATQVKGLETRRYRPLPHLLTAGPSNVDTGTGIPTAGVHSVAYVAGFPAFISFPFFLTQNSDPLPSMSSTFSPFLLHAPHTMTLKDGTRVTPSWQHTMTDSPTSPYATYLDIEPATGRPLRAQKALMGSYAVPSINHNNTRPITNLLLPSFRPNTLIPIFWGQETVLAPSHLLDTLASVSTLAGLLVYMLGFGCLIGVLLLAVALRRLTFLRPSPCQPLQVA